MKILKDIYCYWCLEEQYICISILHFFKFQQGYMYISCTNSPCNYLMLGLAPDDNFIMNYFTELLRV